MTPRLSFLVPLLLLASQAPAAKPTEQERLDKLLAGRTAGKPVSCLPLSRYSESRQIGSTVAYRVGGAWYVNRFLGGCPQLKDDRALVSRHVSRICRGDIADVVMPAPPSIPFGACTFGDFTPYTKAR